MDDADVAHRAPGSGIRLSVEDTEKIVALFRDAYERIDVMLAKLEIALGGGGNG